MASQHVFNRYQDMHVKVGDLTVTGTTQIDNTGVADDTSITLGTGDDAALLWSTGDASNHSTVLALGDSNQALHVTDLDAADTDWNVSADTHPTVYIHSNTTPATDYMTLGAHDGTTAHINVAGGVLALDVAGTTVSTVRAAGVQDNANNAVTATDGGGTTGLIPVGASFCTVTSASANHSISLPAATVGDRIWLQIGATGCELDSGRSQGQRCSRRCHQ